MNRFFFVFLLSFFFTLSVEANGSGSKRYRDSFAKVPPAPEREEPAEEGEEDGKGDGTKSGKTGKEKKKDIAIPAWAKGTDTSAVTVDGESGQLISLSHNGFSEPGAPVIWDLDPLTPEREVSLAELVQTKYGANGWLVFLDENGLSLWPSDRQIRHLAEMGKGPFLPVDDNPAGIIGFYPFSAGGEWPLPGLEGVPGLPLDFSDLTVDLNEPFVLSNIILHDSNPREKNNLMEREIHDIAMSGSEDVQKMIRVLNQLEDFKVVILCDEKGVFMVPEELRDFSPSPLKEGIFKDMIVLTFRERRNTATAVPLVSGNKIIGALIAIDYRPMKEHRFWEFLQFFKSKKTNFGMLLLHELVHAYQYLIISRYDYSESEEIASFMEEEAVSFENQHSQFTDSLKDKLPIRTHYGSKKVSEWARTHPFTYPKNEKNDE